MKKLNLFSVLCLCFSSTIFTYANSDPRVKIVDGELVGTIEKARNGRSFYRFMGIPYGKVTKRFGIASPPDGWNGVKDATKPAPVCLQADLFMNNIIHGVEDCLILNVYTPKVKISTSESEKLLPVIVYIHGGGYIAGSANYYDGKFFLSEDVVFVAINYRVGALGFLNAEIEGASGNQGLKDQVLALQWVQKNIRNFGGNPDQVVIVGESAGGASVSQLTLSSMAKGLFHGAISRSGSFNCPFAQKRMSPRDEAKKLANAVDCPSSNPNYMVECLQRIQGEELVKQTKVDNPIYNMIDTGNVPQFGPTIETVIPSGEDSSKVFFNEEPLQVLIEGRFNKVPWITGANSHEGIFLCASTVLTNETLRELMNHEWGRIGPKTLALDSTARDPPELASKVREFYFKKEEISMANKDALINMYSDRWFVQGPRQAALLYSRFAPVYLYNLTYRGMYSFEQSGLGVDANGRRAATHGDDLFYLENLFDGALSPFAEGSDDYKFSERIVKTWVSFAKNLRPTPWGSLKTWPEVDFKKDLEWVQLDKDVTIQPESKEFASRMDFWDKLLLPIEMKYTKRTGSTLKETCSKPINSLVGDC